MFTESSRNLHSCAKSNTESQLVVLRIKRESFKLAYYVHESRNPENYKKWKALNQILELPVKW